MTQPRLLERRYHRAQSGRGTGCIAGVLGVIVVLCIGAFIGGRVTATPLLGAAVQGPDHGDDPGTIAVHMAQSVAAQLQAKTHAVFVLSEHDLTIIAQYRNPDPESFSDPEVRVRDDAILLSADTRVGPLKSVATVHITILLSGNPLDEHLQPTITQLDLGRQAVPDFMRSAFDPRGNGALAIDPVFNDAQALEQLRADLECVSIANDGLHLGFHRAGVAASATSCDPAAGGV